MEGVSALMRYNRDNLANDPTNWPVDVAAAKRVLGVRTADIYEHHACTNWRCSQPFPYLSPSAYAAHKDDACKECGGRRFKPVVGNRKPQPYRKFWVFGIKTAIEECAPPPPLAKHIRTDRRSPRANSRTHALINWNGAALSARQGGTWTRRGRP